ncbi:MAG: dihydrofolate reductase [Nanoarchaeota archaeon]
MDLRIIVAVSENGVIGINGKVPWDIKEDRVRFRDLTLKHPIVIMGRKTYESILEFLGKPLPNRKNIVLSKTLEPTEGIYVARDIEEAIKLTENLESYVIGGKRVYEEFLPIVNLMDITRVHRNYRGDTFFPEINWEEWKRISEERKMNEDGICFSFLRYLRK